MDHRGPLADLDADTLAVEVLGSVQGFAWWSDRERLGVLARGGDVFALPAHDLVTASGAQWWSDSFDPANQIMLGPSDEPPDVAELADEQERHFRAPWCIPQVLTSSLGLGRGLPAVRLCAVEAVYRWVAHGEPVGCWAVRIAPDARVYEVHRVEDWAELCARYPSRGLTPADYVRWGVTAPTSVAPDWELVRRDWDGLHVSMLGLLTAAGVPIEIDGVGAVLEGVDSEFTTWFRPCLDEPELVTTIARADLP